MELYALILAFSVISLALSVVALIRGAPATLATKADSAFKIATETQDSMASVRAEVSTYLGAIEDERERTQKAVARARSERHRIDNAQPPAPTTREDRIQLLRQRAGIA